MVKPSGSSNYIRGGYWLPWDQSLLTNLESRVYNPPGCRDIKERKKLIDEAPKFGHDLIHCTRITVEAIVLVTSFRKWRKLEVTLSDNHAAFKKFNIILSFVVLTVITSWTFFILKPLETKDFFSVLLAQSVVMVVLCKDTVTRYSQCLCFFEKHPINGGDVCYIGEKWEVRLLDSVFKTEDNLKLELENTSLLPQYIHVATDEEVWNDDVNA